MTEQWAERVRATLGGGSACRGPPLLSIIPHQSSSKLQAIKALQFMFEGLSLPGLPYSSVSCPQVWILVKADTWESATFPNCLRCSLP